MSFDMSDKSDSESEYAESDSYEPDSPDEESHRVSVAWAENKVNAIKELIRNLNGRAPEYGRPDEYENEAVSMAIQQHGLRNNESEINENHSKDDAGEETTSDDIIEDNVYSVRKEKRRCHSSDIQNSAYKQNLKSNSEFDDEDEDNEFLSEAVSVAIRKKGLSSSSTCKPLE